MHEEVDDAGGNSENRGDEPPLTGPREQQGDIGNGACGDASLRGDHEMTQSER